MTGQNQRQLGKTLWAGAVQLCGAINADDFRDYMPAFLFPRYLSDNCEAAAKKELRRVSRDLLSHFSRDSAQHPARSYR